MTATGRALLVVDVQNDFCEGGSLAVAGGAAVAAAITTHMNRSRNRYAVVVASRDWHDPDGTNSGHFALPGETPDMTASWPVHCIAETAGSGYHLALDTALIDCHVRKGQGVAAYSMFDAVTDEGGSVVDLLTSNDVTGVDVVGIAADYCVLQTALGGLAAGFDVTVLGDLCAGVDAGTTRAAYQRLEREGAQVVASA